MPETQQRLSQLQSLEQQFQRVRQVLDGEGRGDDGEQQQLRGIEQMIARIREALSQRDQAAEAETDSDPTGGEHGLDSAAGGTTQAREDLREAFKQARKAWVQVRDDAQRDIETIKDGIRQKYLDDAEQWDAVTQGIKRLDEVLENLNDDLRDALDAYVSTPLGQREKLAKCAAEAKRLLENYLDYVAGSSLMAALDQKEFADVVIKQPVEKALRSLAKTIQ